MAPELELRLWRLLAVVGAVGTGLLACGGGEDDPAATSIAMLPVLAAGGVAAPKGAAPAADPAPQPASGAAAAPAGRGQAASSTPSTPASPCPPAAGSAALGAPRPHGAEAGTLAWQQEVRQELDDAASAAAAQLQASGPSEDPFDRR